MYLQLLQDEDIDCEWQARGLLMVCKQPESMQAYAAYNDLLEAYGLAARRYEQAELLALEPALRHDVIGGYHHAPDTHLRPEALLRQWRQALDRAGVKIVEHCAWRRFANAGGRAHSVITDQGAFSAERFIIAAGAWSTPMCRSLGVTIPVMPGKGYSLTMQRPHTCPKTICYLYEKNMVVTPWPSGLRLGGTMEFAGFDMRRRKDRLENLTQGAAAYFRNTSGQHVMERWTGLRPMCSDDLPIVDHLPGCHNIMVATGHGMLGLSLAPVTGQLVSEMILDRSQTIDPTWLSLGRFNCLGKAVTR